MFCSLWYVALNEMYHGGRGRRNLERRIVGSRCYKADNEENRGEKTNNAWGGKRGK